MTKLFTLIWSINW